MPAEPELVTVFRSADADAEDQANTVRDMLAKANIRAEIFELPGAFDVRVPRAQEEDAVRFIETQRDFTPEPTDLSHDLDMVTVFSSQEYNAEMIAIEVRSILDAHGIPSVLVSSSMFPNLPFEVRVPKTCLEEARRAIVAAEEAGPSAAEQAERDFEAGESGGATS